MNPKPMAETVQDLEGLTPEADLLSWETRGILHRAIAGLPDQYRAVVVLREIEGLSTREVSEVLGISEANVKTRLHRARVLLREQLEPPLPAEVRQRARERVSNLLGQRAATRATER